MTFKAPDSLSEQIARHLAERIIRGELKERERIQEQKVTQAMSVSRGSVREALLILERRHLVDILPNRGAQVCELTARHVRGLYALVMELYILLGLAVAEQWREDEDLEPFHVIQRRLTDACQRDDITAFAVASFSLLQAAYPFAENPYLQQTLDNLQPAIARTYCIALERRRSQMGVFGILFDELLESVIARDLASIRSLLLDYGRQNCELVLAALADR